jgi:hypothetical protein
MRAETCSAFIHEFNYAPSGSDSGSLRLLIGQFKYIACALSAILYDLNDKLLLNALDKNIHSPESVTLTLISQLLGSRKVALNECGDTAPLKTIKMHLKHNGIKAIEMVDVNNYCGPLKD